MPHFVGFNRIESHPDEQVGFCEELDDDGVGGQSAANAVEERVVLRKHALRFRRDEHRRPDGFGEPPQRGGIGVWIQIEAEDQNRPLRFRDFSRHSSHRIAARHARRVGRQGHGRRILGLSIRLSRDVARQRQVHRSEPRFECPPPRATHGRCGVHAIKRHRLFRERTEHCIEIELLVCRKRPRRGRHRRGNREQR